MVSSKFNFLTLTVLIFLWRNFSTAGFASEPVPTGSVAVKSFPAAAGHNLASVVINEIMADPTPVVGLPDAEWIELFNISDSPVRLKNWKLVIGSISKILPDTLILPARYLIVCSSKVSGLLVNYGKILEISSLPALRNSGNHLALLNDADSVMDAVDYSDVWYGDSNKKNGGWSLERIDPERNCGQPANWTASRHPSGGTPGAVNSFSHENKDTAEPFINSASVISPYSVKITFSEPMDTSRLKESGNYRLSGIWSNPGKITAANDTTVQLIWNKPLAINSTYSLFFENLTDPCGNILREKQIEISYFIPEPGDVVINEILFNPWPDGVDFAEIYNISGKDIETGKLILATRDASGQLKSQVSLKAIHSVLKPGDYLALTVDTNRIFRFYRTSCRKCNGQLGSMPAFNNDKGTVVLLSDSLIVLDEFAYNEKMHCPMLNDVEGVSLERVNPLSPAWFSSNWQSASSEAGFATPGCRNSQFQTEVAKHTTVTLEQTTLSPDGDGFNDVLLIDYTTPLPGWMANCRIFDTSGNQVLILRNNSLAGTSGTLQWDGKDETGHRLPLGPYILLIEFFDLNGNREVYKKVVVLTKKGN